MTDTVEETIVVEGVANDASLVSLRAWPEPPASPPAVHLWAKPGDDEARRVKVTIEVLADEPVPQRGDVWEDHQGFRVLLADADDDGPIDAPWWGFIVHAPTGFEDVVPGERWGSWVKPERLIARLGAGEQTGDDQ